MRVTFTQLRAFVTTAQLSSFVDASKALHVTQAALSNAIRDLESTLGFKLLERTTRRVRLSPEGRQFMPYAERALSSLGDIERCASELKSQQQIVRITTSRLVGWTLMTRIYSEFHRAHPEIRLTPIDAHIDEIRASVESGHADLAISTDAVVDSSVIALPLFRTRICLVCPARHPLARRKKARWHEIENEALIFVGRLPLLHMNMQAGPAFRPANVRIVEDSTAALSLVAAGMGLAVSPGFVAPATRVHGLKVVRCEPGVTRQYSLFVNARRAEAPAVRRFRHFVADYFAPFGEHCVEDCPDAVF